MKTNPTIQTDYTNKQKPIHPTIQPSFETMSIIMMTPTPIFRYKLSAHIEQALHEFSKIHQFDDRLTFKDAWASWWENNIETVNMEIRRLTNLEYDGNIEEKMYKSARYYFRKKKTHQDQQPTQRNTYIHLSKELLETIDSHIVEGLNTERYKPSQGFDAFSQSHKDLIQTEMKAKEVDLSKIKKTYKNRYFIIKKNNN